MALSRTLANFGDSLGGTASNVTVTFSDSTQFNTANSLGMRNRLINGAMDFWQRGTSFSNPTSTTTYTADRWSCYRSSYTTNMSISQVTGLTIGTGINRNALRIQRTASDTNTTGLFATQSIESINSKDLAGQNVTISFWARVGANFSATQLGVSVVSGTGTDEFLRGAYTGFNAFINTSVTLTTSFQRFSFTGTVPATANELSVSLGYTPTGTAGAADYFDITDVQLELGTVATPFERRPYGMELALCQRYYVKGYFLNGIYGGTAVQGLIQTPVPMRTTPTTTIGGAGFLQITDTVNAGITQSVSGWGITSTATQNATGNYQFFLAAWGNFSGLTNYRYYYQSEYSGDVDAPAIMSAEL